MTFRDFFRKKILKSKATSNRKIQQVLGSIGLDNLFKIFLRDGLFLSDIGIMNLHPTKCSYWVCYIHEKNFDSYGCAPPKKLFKFIIKQNGYCLYSEDKIQKNDSFCASYGLHIIYLTKVEGMDFKSAVLNLYYQMIQ